MPNNSPVVFSVAAAVTWAGTRVANTVAPNANWSDLIDRYGLPMIFLGLTIHAMTKLYADARKTTSARIADRDAQEQQRIKEFEAAQESRMELKRSIDNQTAAFYELVRELRKHLQ